MPTASTSSPSPTGGGRRWCRARTIGRYLPSGHLVYTNKGTLFAIPFDVDRLETRGTAVPILDDVAYDTLRGGVDMDFAGTGTLVYRKGSAGTAAIGMSTIQWVDGAGKREALRAKPGAYTNFPRLSPDGKRLALLVSEGGNGMSGSTTCSGTR